MTSLPSHTIVPTATGSGRFTERKAWGYVAEVLVTCPLWLMWGKVFASLKVVLERIVPASDFRRDEEAL